MADYPWNWQFVQQRTGGRFTDLDSLYTELRAWSSSSRQLAAAVELLIRCGHAQPHFTWVVVDPSRSYIDFDSVLSMSNSLLSWQRSLLTIATSIAIGTPISLRDELTDLDYDDFPLMLTALTYASGYGGPTPRLIKDNDASPPLFPEDDAAPIPSWRPPLGSWPSDPQADA